MSVGTRVLKDRPDFFRREDRVVVGIQEGRPLANLVDGEARRGASKVLYLKDQLLHTLRIHTWCGSLNTTEKRESGEKRSLRTRSGNLEPSLVLRNATLHKIKNVML